MATVVDVAKKAGVSVATVSRVLNSNHIVTKEKRDKVYKAMEELNYQPRSVARSTKTVEKKIVVVMASVMIEDVLTGIYDMATELEYEVIITYTSSSKKKIESIEGFSNERIVGVIILNAIISKEELIEVSSKLPVVQCQQSSDVKESFIVVIDDEKASYDSVKRLIQQGKRRIGFVGLAEHEDDITPDFSLERYRGYRRALDEFDIPFDKELIKYSDSTYEGGVGIARSFIALKEKLDAVFCVQDTMAVACINVFKDAGLQIPNDIAVSGFDNTEIAQIVSPQLTSVEQPFYEIGYEAMKMLDSLIKGSISTGRRLLINHKIIERESTIGKK